ncbi:methylated-DNA--[protein]-cysteine S-methyltransferase [Burkholderia sp. BCC1644]|uniref:methylated-DNA--[protein]-cysteine S-methyltransferase n=1 Tax=Burkholderia sp. BCC1644 TaxID=2676293 RepID=UPI001590B27F|nr:methylated-DNA--[protein]-cysteine S-methyltransferase [Burkholderia sp. BCC1644]
MKTIHIDIQLDRVRVTATESGPANVCSEGQKSNSDTEDRQPDPARHPMREAARQLFADLDGQRRGLNLPFEVSRGTPLQQAVRSALLAIPRGETISYGDLNQIICATVARAVGATMGRNPVGIAAPGHRVARAGDSLADRPDQGDQT